MTSRRETEERELALGRRLAPVRLALLDSGIIASVQASLETVGSRDEGMAYLTSLRLSDDEVIAGEGHR